MAVLKVGRGKPVTIIARGQSYSAADALGYGRGVRGARVSFDYEDSGYFARFGKPRRQAERDAAEVLAVATDRGASQAIGLSRGARAVVGAMADVPDLFERVVLVLPPGGHAAGRYAPWLESLSQKPRPELSADVLVIARRGDAGHPVRVAEEWSTALGGALEVLTKAEWAEHERLHRLITGLLNS